ncbi:MAG: hypothetical protein PHY16_18250 [Methylobacter sp.]|nr:hypothetical protein [Methylobacter sp.]
MKPTEWPDKTTGEIKHGLSLTVAAVLSAYDITKRRSEPITTEPPKQAAFPFNDPIPF